MCVNFMTKLFEGEGEGGRGGGIEKPVKNLNLNFLEKWKNGNLSE